MSGNVTICISYIQKQQQQFGMKFGRRYIRYLLQVSLKIFWFHKCKYVARTPFALDLKREYFLFRSMRFKRDFLTIWSKPVLGFK